MQSEYWTWFMEWAWVILVVAELHAWFLDASATGTNELYVKKAEDSQPNLQPFALDMTKS